MGPGDGDHPDQRHPRQRRRVRRHLDVRHRHVIVDALKTANHDLVPIVGADNAGFVNQLLDEAGLKGAAVTNPPPSAAPASTSPPRSSTGRSPPSTTVHVTPELWENTTDEGKADLTEAADPEPARSGRSA